jgi:hypothetical protein
MFDGSKEQSAIGLDFSFITSKATDLRSTPDDYLQRRPYTGSAKEKRVHQLPFKSLHQKLGLLPIEERFQFSTVVRYQDLSTIDPPPTPFHESS